jgi:hypothetical protein
VLEPDEKVLVPQALVLLVQEFYLRRARPLFWLQDQLKICLLQLVDVALVV